MASSSRFAIISSDEVNSLAANAKNMNTEKSKTIWINVFKEWAAVRGKNVNFEEYTDAADLDKTLIISSFSNSFFRTFSQ